MASCSLDHELQHVDISTYDKAKTMLVNYISTNIVYCLANLLLAGI